MTSLSPLLIYLPLAGFILLGLFGRSFPRVLTALIGNATVGAAFIIAILNFMAMRSNASYQDIVIMRWVTSGSLDIHLGLFIDTLSTTMMLVVTGVGLLIHIYSIGYMHDDPGFARFFAFMNFFIVAMTVLVMADNFLFLLVGWAGVGLASFLLIGFWYQRPSAVKAAQKAFVINVIGDFGLMIAIFLLIGHMGSVNYTTLLYGRTTLFSSADSTTTAIALMLLIAAAAKSAQLPLHTWLPDAMEGPTPVSALIHAATMVTAGVYLVARTHSIFAAAPYALMAVGVMGGLSAIFAATTALFQYDIKRVLAYSTMSQLGYMFMAESVGAYSGAIFHLTTHAFFKALLFMSAGAVIHALGGEQDIRKMGGLRSKLPITYWSFLIGGLALAGVPPLAGFWSKDAILGAVFAKANETGQTWYYVLWGLGVATAILTGLYIFRLIFVVFMGESRVVVRSEHGNQHGIHEVGMAMALPMVALLILSVLGGFDGIPGFNAIGDFLQTATGNAYEATGGTLAVSLSVGIVAALLGIGLAWALYLNRPFKYIENRNPLYRLLQNAYYLDPLFNVVIAQPVLVLGRGLSIAIENFTLDGGSKVIANIVGTTSRNLRKAQSGYARNYALSIVTGVVLIILFYVYTATTH